MITNAKFKFALKEMMNEKPIEEINVTALCEKCGCHRQTFYYHYEDIYDLIQAILLSEDIPKFDAAKSVKDALKAFVAYTKDNLTFLTQAYNSAAKVLVDDFMLSKLNIKLFGIFAAEPQYFGMKTETRRALARRFAIVISQEIGFCLKTNSHTPEWYQKKMNRFVDNAILCLLPAYADLVKKEEMK